MIGGGLFSYQGLKNKLAAWDYGRLTVCTLPFGQKNEPNPDPQITAVLWAYVKGNAGTHNIATLIDWLLN